MADMPRSKFSRLQGSTIKARTQTTVQMQVLLRGDQKRGRLECNEFNTTLRAIEATNELDVLFLDAHASMIKTHVYQSKNSSR